MTAQLATIHPQSSAPVLASARQIGLTPQSIDEALRMAEIMSRASIVPKDYQGNPGNILVAIQWGAEIGLPPLQAMQNLAVINGRPALWGDAVIALVRGSGLLEMIQEDIAADCATCTVKRKGEPPASRSFSVEDAKRAGLYGKQGPWQQYPKRMLQMRARAWALRDVFPDVLRGVHVAEEAQDMPVAMGQAEVVTDQVQATSRTESLKAKLAARGSRQAILDSSSQPAAVMADGLPVEPAPDLPMVMTLIRDAGTLEELHGASEMAKRLTSETDKAEARKAYKARQSAMAKEVKHEAEAKSKAEEAAQRKREAEEEARLEREAIQAEALAGEEAGASADFWEGV